ncbi:MAG: translation elongation factor Ts [Phycisphaera sp.]|nr:translation elongation factor Ts [Phycisphaera sp.]
MPISAKDVMTLRQRTGLGMMECKKALTETDGDMDAAIEKLREELKGKMDERADRAAVEGALAVATDGDKAVAIIELDTETDFVARGDGFVSAADSVAKHVLAGAAGEHAADDTITGVIDNIRITSKENASYARGLKLAAEGNQKTGYYLHHNRQVGAVVLVEGDVDAETLSGIAQHITAHQPTPSAVDESGLDADEVAAAKAGFVKEAEESGKPAEIAEKIAGGRMRKWVDERTLLGQMYVKDMEGKSQVRDILPKGASIKAFARYEVGVK